MVHTNEAHESRHRDEPTRADALRRIAAAVSGEVDLGRLFEHVIDEAFALFGVDRAGLWTYHDRPTPLRLAAQRGLSDDMLALVAALPRDANTAGMRAMHERRVAILDGELSGTVPALASLYRAEGVRTMCYVPIVVRDEVLGLLVLYHASDYPWSSDEMDLARAFGDQIAIAIRNTRLAASTAALAERLRAISELAVRLSGQPDAAGIAGTIVAEAQRVVRHDSIRVYIADHESGMCEPIAFQGTFLGSKNPDLERLRTKIGEGLTGWVAEHDQILRIGDAAADPRSVIMGDTSEPESMLIVPMTQAGVVQGVIVVSRLGRDRFDADDETTFSIFAGYAAQALVNASNRTRLERQQVELEHQLTTQQRLLDVNERLLSTLDPAHVLDLIADSLGAIVPYDSLSIYEIDRAAGIRRAIIARDRFADLILADEGPIDEGISGWVAAHGEAILSNDAHLDPRSARVPGTPFEPESMIVVPLVVGDEVVGTLNITRVGEAEAHFSPTEFELTKLFGGQASIALQNARTHGEVQVRADHDALTGLRNHGAFQRDLGEAIERGGGGRPFAVLMMDLDAFKAFNDSQGHPAGDELLGAIARSMSAAVRGDDRLYRYGGDEFAAILAGADRVTAHDVAERLRRAVAAAGDGRDGPAVAVSIGVACFPDDGRVKGALVTVADQAMYLAKPARRQTAAGRDDPYVRALDETALALLERQASGDLLETIITRAGALVGTAHGFIYLADAGGAGLLLRSGTGLYAGVVGHRLEPGDGLSGEVFESGESRAVDDYDTYERRNPAVPIGLIGSIVGVPLIAGGEVVGVIGLASGSVKRAFGPQEIDALTRFAQLASIAIVNARLVDEAQFGARHDPVTGLPNREVLTDRIASALARTGPGAPEAIAVVLLDLDRFKIINESVGHAAGDQLLVAVGQRLAGFLRPGDTIARFAGDEFGVILDPVADQAEARQLVGRLLAALQAPFALSGRDWFIGASVGIAIGRPGQTTPADLLREAEIARVRAEADPTHRHALFEPAMGSTTLERIDLENDLRRGIERGELRLHYQPIIDLASERVVGFEALVRWQHPERGLLQPGSFIPLAEETGLIVPLGRWVLETACRQASSWSIGRGDRRSLAMSVNLSARQFTQTDLAEEVGRVLAASGLPARALELEITESIVMDRSEDSMRMLRRLRSMGVRLVLDDFGTGYSSLSYLKHLPLDTIKVDQSFVAGLEDPADRSIVSSVIGLARGLGLDVIAEGIETREQQARLLELGCAVGQGYLFSRPVPADEAARLMEPRRSGSRPAGHPARPTVSSGSRRRGGA